MSLLPNLHPIRLSRRPKQFDSDDYLFELKIDGYRCGIALRIDPVSFGCSREPSDARVQNKRAGAEKYCMICHDDAKMIAGLSLEKFTRIPIQTEQYPPNS